MISEKCRECPACGWCEYDFVTDTVYPAEENKCLMMGDEK